MKRGKFQRRGALAIDAAAFGLEFTIRTPAPFKSEGDVAIVSVDGPLTHHEELFWDSYDAVKERVRAAIDSPCKSVILEINSPGGDAAGCLETSREIRTLARVAGKKLYAFVDGMAASAGYALACSADEIIVTETACVGSVGVVSPLVDTVVQDKMFGERWAIVTSGAHKADRNPHVPISDGAIAETQRQVDELAELFFTLVGESRRTATADSVRALEAGLFHGKSAVERGLADRVSTKDALVTMLAKSATETRPSAETEDTMGWKEALKKAAEEGDEEAKKALAALDETDGDEEKKDGDEKTEADPPPPPPKKDDEEEKKKDDAKALSARVEKLEREAKADKATRMKSETAEKEQILAGLTISEPQAKVLRAMSLEAMKAAVDAFAPSAAMKVVTPAQAPTLGAGQGGEDANGGRTPRLPAAESNALKARMGLDVPTEKIRREGIALVLPMIDQKQAKANLASLGKEGAK